MHDTAKLQRHLRHVLATLVGCTPAFLWVGCAIEGEPVTDHYDSPRGYDLGSYDDGPADGGEDEGAYDDGPADDGGGEHCETAYAKGTHATCFTEYGASKWGWTNSMLPSYSDQMPVYAGAGQCNTSKGELVGYVTFHYDAYGNLSYVLELLPGYEAQETHVYAGDEPCPWGNNGCTFAPGQFSVDDDLYGEIYVIFHAVVCE